MPRGLTLTTISPHLVSYRLPNEHGLLVRGVAFYDGSEDFEDIRVVFAPSDDRLAAFF